MPSILGHPVLRREDPRFLTGLGSGRGHIQDVAVGGSRDVRITAYQLDVIQDSGAYPLIAGFLPRMTMAMVQNAVIDALSHLGIRHLDMPMSPQRVWKALQNHV